MVLKVLELRPDPANDSFTYVVVSYGTTGHGVLRFPNNVVRALGLRVGDDLQSIESQKREWNEAHA